MKRVILLFKSTRDAIRAERLCTREAIPAATIPVPRHLSARCGIALEVHGDASGRVSELLAREGVEAHVHPRES
jgi:hypothetical protein